MVLDCHCVERINGVWILKYTAHQHFNVFSRQFVFIFTWLDNFFISRFGRRGCRAQYPLSSKTLLSQTVAQPLQNLDHFDRHQFLNCHIFIRPTFFYLNFYQRDFYAELHQIPVQWRRKSKNNNVRRFAHLLRFRLLGLYHYHDTDVTLVANWLLTISLLA